MCTLSLPLLHFLSRICAIPANKSYRNPQSPILLPCPLPPDPLQESGKSKPSDAPNRTTIAAVGDSLPHDILGALRTQISSVFVVGGVHFEELGVEQGGVGVPSDDAASAAFSKHLEGEGAPTHVVPAFRW